MPMSHSRGLTCTHSRLGRVFKRGFPYQFHPSSVSCRGRGSRSLTVVGCASNAAKCSGNIVLPCHDVLSGMLCYGRGVNLGTNSDIMSVLPLKRMFNVAFSFLCNFATNTRL